jgi:hypothetical protein
LFQYLTLIVQRLIINWYWYFYLVLTTPLPLSGSDKRCN